MPALPSEALQEPLLARITIILTSLHTALSESSPLTLSIASRRTSPPTLQTLSFPGDTAAQACRFTIYLSLLSTIHHLLSTNQTATKRNIFYQNVPLFQKQTVVDKAVEELAATFCVPRSALGIVAAGKGMAKGGMRIAMVGGGMMECAAGATLIPPGIQVGGVELREEVEWVLLVEKDAIFQRLDGGRKGVVVTGKGYLDVATRELLVRLVSMGKPVFALVDLDPHGIEIMATVRFGSKTMGHEGEALCVKGLKWIGVRYEDLVDVVQSGGGGLLELTLDDRQRAVSILTRVWIEAVPEWKEALQKMLFYGIKAEIEILGEGLREWVERKVANSSA